MSISESEQANSTHDLSPSTSPGPDSKKRDRESDLTEDERREERKAANRRSAFQSRLRKKLLIEELQGKVNKLTEELTVLKENNRTLTLGLEASLQENRRLRFLHQQGGGLGGGLGGGGLSAQSALLGLNGGGFGSLMGQMGQMGHRGF